MASTLRRPSPYAKRSEKMKTFRSLELAIQFHESIKALRVEGHLRDQLFRAATSIPLNLSEGNARPTSRDKKRFYQTAYASLKECQTIFRLIPLNDEVVAKQADHLGACLYKLMMAENPVLRK
jgi:four helix bundle protein